MSSGRTRGSAQWDGRATAAYLVSGWSRTGVAAEEEGMGGPGAVRQPRLQLCAISKELRVSASGQRWMEREEMRARGGGRVRGTESAKG